MDVSSRSQQESAIDEVGNGAWVDLIEEPDFGCPKESGVNGINFFECEEAEFGGEFLGLDVVDVVVVMVVMMALEGAHSIAHFNENELLLGECLTHIDN